MHGLHDSGPLLVPLLVTWERVSANLTDVVLPARWLAAKSQLLD